MASGKRCGSLALSGETKCYYHIHLDYRLPYGRLMFIEPKKDPKPGEYPYEFPVPVLEDAAAIQIGFMQALHGVCNGNLPPRKAKLVLSALHGARMNLKHFEDCLAALTKTASAKNKKKPPAGAKPVATNKTGATAASKLHNTEQSA